MFYNDAKNINEAFRIGLSTILGSGIVGESRNGNVLRLSSPMMTIYSNPRQRVLTNSIRRPNPFFHLMESLWMLAGRNDINFVAKFNRRMSEYSDDGYTQPAAYGYRWVNHFEYDQIRFVIDELNRNPNSRRAVISMWDPNTDIEAVSDSGKDVPCNTTMYFLKRPHGKLDMTVCNRSNDTVWGCYGANAVHMSILQEYIALSTGLEIGKYYQLSNDLHIYTDVFSEETLQEMRNEQCSMYIGETLPLFSPEDEKAFNFDLELFFSNFDNDTSAKYESPFFKDVVSPMYEAWHYYKCRDKEKAILCVNNMASCDWYYSAKEWLEGVNW